jgi:hypothetical protein
MQQTVCKQLQARMYVTSLYGDGVCAAEAILCH